MSINNKRPALLIFIILFFGCIIGTALTLLFGYILPEDNVVTKFLLNQVPIGWGEKPDQWVDLYVIKFKTGFYFNVSVISLIGMMISWYFLRYFR